MSLTQERIYTIATEIAHNTVVSEALFDKELFDFVDAFLSRIREEQKVYGWHLTSHIMTNFTRHKQTADKYENIPLFTIPPAAPDCSKLVEALEKIANESLSQYDGDANWLQLIAQEALAKHKASMGEKE